MSRDPFEDLAGAIRKHAASIAGRPVRHLRAVIVDLDPLTAVSDDKKVTLSEDDDDVELSRDIIRARTALDLSVGDVLDVRADADGFFLQGIFA